MLTKQELEKIGRTARHATATRGTPTDSWLNGYQEDVPRLLAHIEELERRLAGLVVYDRDTGYVDPALR